MLIKGCFTRHVIGDGVFNPYQCLQCFLEQEMLPLKLSTGFIQERTRSRCKDIPFHQQYTPNCVDISFRFKCIVRNTIFRHI